MQGHVEPAGVFDGTQMENLGAVCRHFEGFFVSEGSDVAGGFADAGVGGEDAVDIGLDLAHVRPERRREGNRGGVGAAAAEGGDVVVPVHALEAGDDRDFVVF